jgi:3-oxoacyl-[acyl-carrier-protein] synthase-1
VASLPPSSPGPARIAALALRAVQDLMRDLSGAALGDDGGAATGWFLALPDEDAVTASWALDRSLGPAFLDRLGQRSAGPIATRSQGGAGSLAILADAAAAIRRGAIARAVVVGADSFVDRDRLALLDRDLRIKSARASAGMVPGEAGTALLLEGAQNAARRRARVLAILSEVGEGVESQPLAGERESTGRGLTQALRAVLARSASHAPRWVLCNLDGEPYRAQEWGTVGVRLARELGAGLRLWHPADCIGEIGAGIGGVLIAQAIAGFARRYAPAPEALLWAGSDGGARAAVRVIAPAPGSEE